jgi:hypothetical protein
MREPIPVLLQYAYVAWCSVRKEAQGLTLSLPLPLYMPSHGSQMLSVMPFFPHFNVPL